MDKIILPHQKAAREQRKVVCWSLMHVITIVCLFTGMHFGHKYMMMPDRVIVMDKAKNLYYGSSYHVICEKVVKNIARRATVAFLDRSFEHDHHKLCEAIFGRSAQKSLQQIIRSFQGEFSSQMIRQTPEIKSIETANAGEPNQCLAYVKGILYRTGIYMNIPYRQTLEFTLGLRLMRSPGIKTFPLRVLKMIYEEHAIYDSKPTTGAKS